MLQNRTSVAQTVSIIHKTRVSWGSTSWLCWSWLGLLSCLGIGWLLLADLGCRGPGDWGNLALFRGPQPSDHGPAPVRGLLGTGPHSRRWAVGEWVKLHLLLPIAQITTWTIARITAWIIPPIHLHYCLNTPPPPAPSVAKLSSIKRGPGAKKVGDCCSIPLLLIPQQAGPNLFSCHWQRHSKLILPRAFHVSAYITFMDITK